MKNFLRIFRFGKRLRLRASVFVITMTLAVVFSAFNLALIYPLLNILFNQVDISKDLVLPENTLSIDYALYVFKLEFLNIIKSEGKQAALMMICLMILVSVFLANVFKYMANLISARIRTDIVKVLRTALFDKVTRMHMGFFTNERRGDLISRLTNDVQEVEHTVLNSFQFLLKEPVTFVVYIVSLFLISFELTLFTLIVLPIAGGLLTEVIKRLRRQSMAGQEALGRAVNIFDETLGGMRVIKAFNARKFLSNKMEKETESYRKISYSIAINRELSSPLSEFMGVGIVLIILYYGGTLILKNEAILEPGAFITYLAFFSQVIPPAKAFSSGITNLQKGLAASVRIFEVVDTPEEVSDKEDAVKLDNFQDEIEFRNVGFAYDSVPVLENISFRLPKGKIVALVGPSGGGKSTLADLVPRFYDATRGEVLIDGRPLQDYTTGSIRDHMGIVTQESILFNDTVFNNIAFGLENADKERVVRAAQIANAHGFIEELPESYETMIGERGSRLSGGQRQRISIARAVLKDPGILILDEATSALDSESEKLVQEALTKLMTNRTTLVIAHRLSTIKHADEILVIDYGKIVERGNHDDLLAKKGIYKKLSEMQNIFIDSE